MGNDWEEASSLADDDGSAWCANVKGDNTATGFLGVSEAAEDLLVDPEDFEIDPEDTQDDDSGWRVIQSEAD